MNNKELIRQIRLARGMLTKRAGLSDLKGPDGVLFVAGTMAACIDAVDSILEAMEAAVKEDIRDIERDRHNEGGSHV